VDDGVSVVPAIMRR